MLKMEETAQMRSLELERQSAVASERQWPIATW
jgi:hypothetical protein